MASSLDPVGSSANRSPETIMARLFNPKTPTNTLIARISKLLSTQQGIDSSLCVTTYALTFAAASLARLSQMNLGASVRAILASTAKVNSSGPARKSTDLTAWVTGMRALAGTTGEMRVFMRLWGMLGVWNNIGRLYDTGGPKDPILKTLSWAQISTITTYLFLENTSYLGHRGVLQGWKPEDRAAWMSVAIRVFALHVGLDFVRLWRLSSFDNSQSSSEKAVQVSTEEKKVEDAKWWRSLYYDSVFVPLCMHWTNTGGVSLPEELVGLLGMVYAGVGFETAWKNSK